MKLAFVAWFAVLVAWLAPTEGLARPQEARAEVECPTCKGKGRAQVDCSVCGGTGEIGCRACNPMLNMQSELAGLDETVSDEALIELRKKLGGARESLEALGAAMKRTAQPGRVACPAPCAGGTALGRSEECKLCAGKGSFPCTACSKKGVLKCGACSGRKRVERACRDCGASGHLPDPAAIPSERRGECSWCSGSLRDCGDCVDGEGGGICGACNGAKSVVCARCVGTGSSSCRKCTGTGRYVDASVLPPAGRDCGDCGASGCVECGECVKGKAKCKACKGAGTRREACATCLGNRKRPCPGCFRGAFRHWEIAAQLLAKTDVEGAVANLEIARSRIGPYFERRAKLFAETDEERAAYETDRKAAEKRVDARIAALRPRAEETRHD